MKKLLVLLAFFAIASIANAEMLNNGDFELDLSDWGSWGSGSGSGSGPAWTGWAWHAMPAGSATIAPSGGSDGGKYAVLDTSDMDGYMTAGWSWAWQGVWQNDLPATEGQTITVSGFAKDLLDKGSTLHVFYEWEDAAGNRVDYDGSGDIVNNSDRTHLSFPLAADGTWESFGIDFVVPSGLDIAQFNSLFSVEGEAAKIGIDQLSIVPEPVSIGLLGLGGLFLRRRRS